MREFIDALAAGHAPVAVSTTMAERRAHARDRWPAASKWSDEELAARLPGVVVTPSTAEEVARVLRLAREHGVAVIPFGAGSGVVGGVVGSGDFVSIDLGGLRGEPTFDDERGEVTVPAGVIGADLERMLNDRGRRLPHYPQSLALASVGGLVATRSSGTFSSKYGNIEDLLVALEVVLADGSIISTKASPRSSTGPSIAQLFVGSEGTLGVITKVTLRTFPLPQRRELRGIAYPSVAEGLTAVRRLLDSGVLPAVIRLYDPAEAEHLFVKSGLSAGRSLLILGFDGHAAVVQAELDVALTCARELGGEDLGSGPGEAWDQTRFDASWLDRGNAGEFSYADAIEVSVGWPDLLTVYTEVLHALAPHADTAYAHFSHFYPDGGAIYFILFTSGSDKADAASRYRTCWDTVLETVTKYAGSISHHHGVGEARKHWMPVEHGGSLQVLAAVKKALDPAGILAPGKLGENFGEDAIR